MRWLICIWLSFTIGCTVAQSSVGELLQHSVFKHTSTGLSVRDLSTGIEVMAEASDRLLAPASSLKLLTTFVGISLLGADYRFETILGYTGSIGPDGTLTGDLVIVGGGDPTLGSDRLVGSLSNKALLQDIVHKCQKAGITCIDGNIVINTYHYGEQAVPDQWNYNDIGNYYASGSWAVNINENMYDLYFRGGQKVGSGAQIQKIEPQTKYVQLQSLVTVAGANTGDQAYVYGIPRQPRQTVRGTIPATKGTFSIKGALPNPPLVLAELLEGRLQQAGIQTHGHYLATTKPQINTIHTYRSPPLSAIVAAANHSSINLYCEAILKEMGRRKGKTGSISEGLRVVSSHLQQLDLPTEELILKDGSGLAGENKITASLMTAYLLKAQKELGSTVLSMIPQVSKEGTVKNLLKDNPSAAHFYLKSGSFEGVQSYTGYVKGKSGKSYSICLMVNNYTAKYSNLKLQLEKLLLAVHTSG